MKRSLGSAKYLRNMTEFTSPKFSFGIIGDPQYCDTDDGSNYAKSVIRRYRQSLDILKEASSAFQQHSTHCNVVLGDTIDGHAKTLGKHYDCIEAVKAVTGKNCHYILGNHDYYNFNRTELKELLIPPTHQHICSEEVLYYDFSPSVGHRFIVLDGYDDSIIGASSEAASQAADSLVKEKNPNYRAGSNDWFLNIPLEDYRYVPFNGGISDRQFDWLANTLATAKANNEKCFIFCHQPIHVMSSKEANLLWNAEAVLDLIQHEDNSHVVAFFAGHDHDGGYSIDEAGIHHLVPPAPLECEVGQVAYGIFDVHDDHLFLHWTGKLPSCCVGHEGADEVAGMDMKELQGSTENPASVQRGIYESFLANSTPCIWPEKLIFREGTQVKSEA